MLLFSKVLLLIIIKGRLSNRPGAVRGAEVFAVQLFSSGVLTFWLELLCLFRTGFIFYCNVKF